LFGRWLLSYWRFILLAKKYRLNKRELSGLYKKGSILKCDQITARFNLNKTNHNRFAVVISKKILAKATERNAFRRNIYEMLKDLIKIGNYDVALFFYKTKVSKEDILKILGKVGIVKP
jgi:ribonuclease P protein component